MPLSGLSKRFSVAFSYFCINLLIYYYKFFCIHCEKNFQLKKHVLKNNKNKKWNFSEEHPISNFHSLCLLSKMFPPTAQNKIKKLQGWNIKNLKIKGTLKLFIVIIWKHIVWLTFKVFQKDALKFVTLVINIPEKKVVTNINNLKTIFSFLILLIHKNVFNCRYPFDTYNL